MGAALGGAEAALAHSALQLCTVSPTHCSMWILCTWLGALLVSCSGFGAARLVTINNTRPRLDSKGQIMNAHDGTVRWLEGAWWMHAAEYGECADPAKHGSDTGKSSGCGFGPLHNVSIYRSPDLSSGSWEFVGHAVECAMLNDCGVLYRPHLSWNPNTKL